jgi:hypothetical protein
VNSFFNARLDKNHRQQKKIAPKNALQCVRFCVFEEISLNNKKKHQRKSLVCLVIMHHALVDAFETEGKTEVP